MGPDDKVAGATPKLKQGAVYFMRHRKVASSKPHFHVVLNKKPLEDDRICTAIITSQLDTIKEFNRQPGTVVYLFPKDYSKLHLPSAIDCNSLAITNRDIFKEDIRYRASAKRCNPFPRPLLEKVIAGVAKSDIVEPYIKKLIC